MDNVPWGRFIATVLAYGFFFWVLLPVGLSATAGFIRTRRATGAGTGAVIGLAVMAVSMFGAGVVLEVTGSFKAAFIEASALAVVGAALAWWVCGFWEIG